MTHRGFADPQLRGHFRNRRPGFDEWLEILSAQAATGCVLCSTNRFQIVFLHPIAHSRFTPAEPTPDLGQR
jgi:hypothetical protein